MEGTGELKGPGIPTEYYIMWTPPSEDYPAPDGTKKTRCVVYENPENDIGLLKNCDWDEDDNADLFIDYGKVWNRSWPKIKDFNASAGVGLTWQVWDWLDYFFNMQAIRLDFPVWMNQLPAGEQTLDLRWLIRFDFN